MKWLVVIKLIIVNGVSFVGSSFNYQYFKVLKCVIIVLTDEMSKLCQFFHRLTNNAKTYCVYPNLTVVLLKYIS